MTPDSHVRLTTLPIEDGRTRFSASRASTQPLDRPAAPDVLTSAQRRRAVALTFARRDSFAVRIDVGEDEGGGAAEKAGGDGVAGRALLFSMDGHSGVRPLCPEVAATLTEEVCSIGAPGWPTALHP